MICLVIYFFSRSLAMRVRVLARDIEIADNLLRMELIFQDDFLVRQSHAHL